MCKVYFNLLTVCVVFSKCFLLVVDDVTYPHDTEHQNWQKMENSSDLLKRGNQYYNFWLGLFINKIPLCLTLRKARCPTEFFENKLNSNWVIS